MVENQEKSNFTFKDTTATQKVFELTQRIRGVCGGTSASKTISILVWIIDYCQTEQERDKIVHVVSESFPHLENGAMLDFQLIMKDRGYWDENRWHSTRHEYTFETGHKLRFMSVDTYGKAHGPRRDVLFVNECNNLDWKIVDQLITRTREIVWLDWNPSEEFWFYTEIKDKRTDYDFLTLTYLDNEALDQNTIDEIEAHRHDKNWWNVYGLGNLGVIQSRIYSGWKVIPEIPHEAELIRRCLDFGYTADPTVIIDIYKYNGGYIFDEIVYKTKMLNKDIIAVLEGLEQVKIIADAAEPKSIEEIRQAGFSIFPSRKGAGSINRGIQAVQSISPRVSITERSVHTIKEYRNYLFITDKDGNITNEPIDFNNHSMDALRYGVDDLKNPVVEKAAEVQKQAMARNRARSAMNSNK